MVTIAADQVREFILRIARSLVDQPDDVQVNLLESGSMIVVELSTAPRDMGKVIGREGRLAQALRILLNAYARKLGKKIVLQIVEK